MKLSELFQEDNVIPDLKAEDKKGVLEELVEALVGMSPILTRKPWSMSCLKESVSEARGSGMGWPFRTESLPGSTGPASHLEGAEKDLILNPWMESRPTSSFFWWHPKIPPASICRLLPGSPRFLKNSGFRKELMEVPGRREIYRKIVQNDEES
jgi:hypothetical protein